MKVLNAQFFRKGQVQVIRRQKTMTSLYRMVYRAITLLVTFSVLHVYVLTGAVKASDPSLKPQATATLKTTNNQSILVNGNSVTPGTTILPGSTVETPAGVGATLQLGFADLDIAPGTELVVEFAGDGSVKVTLKRGCAILKTNTANKGTIMTPDGTSTSTGDQKRADVCFPLGASSPIVNQGAAANAGAGAGGIAGTTATGGTGISNALLVTLLVVGGTTGLVLYLANRGDDESPSNP
jgi:hypothetical protein